MLVYRKLLDINNELLYDIIKINDSINKFLDYHLIKYTSIDNEINNLCLLVKKRILNVINYFNELKNANKPKYSDDELITIFEYDKPIKHKNNNQKKNTTIKNKQSYAPKPDKIHEPKPDIIEEPKPNIIQEPKPDIIEEPKPDIIQKAIHKPIYYKQTEQLLKKYEISFDCNI